MNVHRILVVMMENAPTHPEAMTVNVLLYSLENIARDVRVCLFVNIGF